MERPGWLNAGFLIFIYFLPQCLFLELRTSRFYCHRFFFLPTFEHFKTHFSQSFSSERNNFLQKSVDVEVKVIDLLLCFCFTQHFGGTVVWKSLWKSDDWTRLSVETFLNQRRKKKTEVTSGSLLMYLLTDWLRSSRLSGDTSCRDRRSNSSTLIGTVLHNGCTPVRGCW